jgi:hypothetical protein
MDTGAVAPQLNPAYDPNAKHARNPSFVEILESDDMA